MSNGDGDETIHSELSYGCYVTEDYKAALPNYLVHLNIQNDVIVEIDIDEGLKNRVNGKDLDDDIDNARGFDDKMREVKM